jgi:hypothetical protein
MFRTLLLLEFLSNFSCFYEFFCGFSLQFFFYQPFRSYSWINVNNDCCTLMFKLINVRKSASMRFFT